MIIPEAARYVMQRLRDAGYEAYLVGGCVRDMLMGRTPHDWDVCTAARPEQMQAVFAGDRTVEAGLKHGTLGIVYQGELIEATTWRTESAYSDRRHPDRVCFVKDIRADLARRDFTVNAMAYNGESGLVDPFDGADDIGRRLIRCVGTASERFDEDALRILRALRFAARFGFAVEEETAVAIHAQYETLRDISAERIWAEFKALVMGEHAAPVLRQFADVVAFVIPGAEPFGEDAPPELSIRLALLLRKSGAAALDGMRCERNVRREVAELLEAEPPADERSLWRQMLHCGAERTRQIALMHGWTPEQTAEAMRRSPCPSLRELAVDGAKLRALGYSGAAIGQTLQALAEAVLSGVCPNEKSALITLAEDMKAAI